MPETERRAIENRVRVEQALDQLYTTHIEEARVAFLRGAAIRAVNALHLALGGRDLIREREPGHHGD